MTGVRFAPSPTGRFHIGNLRTAWISWRWARGVGRPWVVRFEDIDSPRSVPGAREAQLEDLAALGLIPDTIHIQSTQIARHREVFAHAAKRGWIYPCYCSRKEVKDALAAMASAPHGGPSATYHGQCRRLDDLSRPLAKLPSIAWRFRGADESGAHDFLIGRTAASLDVSSFEPAYQWACAIDDYDGGYDVLVRAWDLEHVAPLQRAVHAILSQLEGERPFAAIYHCALVVDAAGHRLEKRTAGVTLPEMIAAGISAGGLLRRFEETWKDRARTLAPGAIDGESARTITLAELGL